MLRINSLHNKTKEIDINDMPYNNKKLLIGK